MMANELSALKTQNETTTEKLTDINQEILSRILKYVQISRIGAFDREIIRKDLIGMAIEAEKREKTLSDIIGDDEKSWCDSIVDGYGKVSLKELILSILNQISLWWFMWGIMFFDLAPSVVKFDVGHLSLFLLYALILSSYTFFISYKFAFQSLLKQFFINSMFFIGVTILIAIPSRTLKGIVLFSIPNYVIHLVFGTIWASCTFLYKDLIHKQANKINWME